MVKLSAMCIDTAPVCCPSWVSGPVVMSSCRYMQGLRMLCGAMNSFIARWRTRVYKLPTARIVHKARVILVHYTVPSLLQSPAYRSSDSGRLLYFGRVIFSVHQIFDVTGPIFAKLCHTTRCVLKYFISYVGVHTCPLKI